MKYRLSPQMLKRIEIFLLTFAGALIASPSGRAFLQTHPFYDDMVVCAYIAFRAADKPNPTLPGAPGANQNQ